MPDMRVQNGFFQDQAWSSAAVSNNTAVATIPAVAGLTAVVTGADITGTGATGGSIIDATVINLQSGNTLHIEIPVATGVLAPVIAANGVLEWRPPNPLAASAPNTAIGITVPAFGSGNTNASVIIYGYYRE